MKNFFKKIIVIYQWIENVLYIKRCCGHITNKIPLFIIDCLNFEPLF
jgi:hypothetical protein